MTITWAEVREVRNMHNLDSDQRAFFRKADTSDPVGEAVAFAMRKSQEQPQKKYIVQTEHGIVWTNF